MFMLDNQPLQIDTPFTHEDIQYPANWLRLASVEDKSTIGITEVADPVSYDDRFYWGVGNPKDLEQVKANMISQIKATANSLLASTDWKVVRFAETGTVIDAETAAFRTAVRADSNANENAVNACTSVDELAVLQFTWSEL